MSGTIIETTRKDGQVTIRAWTPDAVDHGVYQQARDTSNAHGVVLPVVLMPDAHLGYGAAIGSVVATEGAIIPSSVGVDIGCGMSAVRLDMQAEALPDNLSPVLDAFVAHVPTMKHEGRRGKTTRARADSLKWLDNHPIPSGREHMARAREQMGTLGGGNHFLELSVDEDDRVWLVVHSGSRGAGNKLANHHINIATECDKAAPNGDLASLKEGSAEFNAYRADMLWGQDYAYHNREAMLNTAVDAFLDAINYSQRHEIVQERVRCHHNYAVVEIHDGREMWVTRKGAIRAQQGDKGIIPGSMGTSTFIVEGLGNPASYCSASHGAGRVMSRSQAKKRISESDLRSAMAGRVWLENKADNLRDEAPQAYKDIQEVMAAQSDLCRPISELQAIVNFKGTRR